MQGRLLLSILLLVSFVEAQDATLYYNGTAILLSLETPWQNSLDQTNPSTAAFVQAAWIYGNVITAYNPLVITLGTSPALTPPFLNIPNGAAVALWFGFNGNSLTLADNNNGNTLAGAMCVNGEPNSVFGQFAYCNAINFYNTVNIALNNGMLQVPPLGTANDGLPCPTSRDFFVVDATQSYGTMTSYFVTSSGKVAQGTLSNANTLGGSVTNTLVNPSDLRVLSAISSALGCTPWMVSDATETTVQNNVLTFPTAEIQASVWQQAPIALVPITDLMTKVNNNASLPKTNLYRFGAYQSQASTTSQADGTVYCQNFYLIAPKRLAANYKNFLNTVSPNPSIASNLFGYLVLRAQNSFGPNGLNCATLLNVANPFVPITNNNGVVVDGTITGQTTKTNVGGSLRVPFGIVSVLVMAIILGF